MTGYETIFMLAQQNSMHKVVRVGHVTSDSILKLVLNKVSLIHILINFWGSQHRNVQCTNLFPSHIVDSTDITVREQTTE
jgi:hypothetical protein